MKKNILSLVVLTLLALSGPLSAQITPTISVQGTNATLRWASTPGETYMVLYRRAFHPDPELQWKLIGTNVQAGLGTETVFQHTGGVPLVPAEAGGGGGGGGGGSSPPEVQSAIAPGTETDDKDKVKKKDSELPTFPALPDEKALEKWLKDMLKEYERQQRESGGVQTFSALMASSLTAAQATSNSMGYYAVTRPSDDSDLDGMPDYWEAQYGLNLLADDAQTDTDGDGVPNLAEYAYGTNPRDPSSKPVVYVSYTSPVNTNTYFPVVQITGNINLNVRTLRIDVTNAAGGQTDLEGFVTQRIVVPGSGFTNSPSRYTNSFQCFDVPLTNGANTVGLRFTDAYGLTFATTVSFTVDFSASPAAPVGNVFWPASGAQIGTDTFTLRGRLDNPTASVIARMTIDGEEQEIGGLVERDGTFWLEELPTPASGPVTLVFTDAGGKATTNTINLSRSPVSLVLSDPSGPNLWDQTMNLSGTVSDAAYSVWANGIRATVDEGGNWSAENVPVNAGGVASFALRAVPNSDNGGAGTGAHTMVPRGGAGGLFDPPTGNPGSAGAADATFDFDKPPRIVVSSYTMRTQDDNPLVNHPDLGTGHTNRQTMEWTRSGAGYSGFATDYWQNEDPSPQTNPYYYYTRNTTWPYPGTNGVEYFSGLYLNEESQSYTNDVGPPYIPWETGSVYQRTTERSYSYKGETQLELQTGGRGLANTASLFEFTGSAVAYNAEGGSVSLAPESLYVMNQALDANGVTYRENIPPNTTLGMVFYSLNPEAQVPTTVQPSAGARSVFSMDRDGIRIRPYQQPYYLTPTNRLGTNTYIRTPGPLYLGYSGYVLPYEVTQNGGAFSGYVRETVAGTPYTNMVNEIQFGFAQRYADMRWWTGVVPQRQIGPGTYTNQVRNSRQFIDPFNQGSHARLFARKAADSTNYARLSMLQSPIRYEAKAVVISAVSGSGTHLGVVTGHLQTMRYTPISLSDPTPAAAASSAQLGLVWYSISHGQTNGAGQFVSVSFDGTFAPTNLPTGLKYSLAFINGCASASQNDPGGATAEFRSRFGPDCVFVGWRGEIHHANAMLFATHFFQHLASGMSAGAAKDEAIRTSGLTGAQSTSGGLYTVEQNIMVLPIETAGMIVDLRN